MWSKLHSALHSCVHAEQGQALAEYGMVLALIAIVCLIALVALGALIAANFGDITAVI